MSKILMALFVLLGLHANAQRMKLAVLRYNGGGDWYANLATSVPNLIKFCNQELNMDLDPEQAVVEVSSPDIFNYPLVHMTGHGNVIFSQTDIDNLRAYLFSGGFLHIDDNYGMDEFIRPQLKRAFPELELVELPASHPIYHQKFDFPKGLPKAHEHDGKPAKGYGLIHEGRLILYYTYETDLGDGWESPDVHGNSEETRQKALRMGANIVQYVMLGRDPLN